MQTPKKILVLVESLDVNDSSGTKGRVALLQNLALAGFEVTALHYTQRDIKLEHIQTMQVKERKSFFYLLSRAQRYLYKWFKINVGDVYEKKSGFSFNWKVASHAFAKALKAYNPQDFDMIWTLGKGTQFRAHHAVLGCPEWHTKWYAYVHDPYPQQLYPRPYNYVPLGYKKKRYFFRDVTEKAHKMVFPSQLLKEWMGSYFVAIAGKSVIVPHQITEHKEVVTALPSYFEAEKFTVLHAGNLLDLRDPLPILEAFAGFIQKHPEASAQLLFLGKLGRFKETIASYAREYPSIYGSKDYVPFKEVYAMQQEASVNIILEAQGEISPFLPGKFPHCVAANKPILLVSPYYSETKRLLGEEYPYIFEFDQVIALEKAITQLYTNWESNKALLLNRNDLEEYMSPNYLKEILT